MSKKRRKARHGNQKRKRRAKSGPVLMTEGLDGNVTMSPLPEVDPAHLVTYVEAHVLLPEGLDYGELPSKTDLRAATESLDAKEGSPRRRLEAIVLLGHSPCPEAAHTLRRYARSKKPYAGLAPIAVAECVDLMARQTKLGRCGMAS